MLFTPDSPVVLFFMKSYIFSVSLGLALGMIAYLVGQLFVVFKDMVAHMIS